MGDWKDSLDEKRQQIEDRSQSSRKRLPKWVKVGAEVWFIRDQVGLSLYGVLSSYRALRTVKCKIYSIDPEGGYFFAEDSAKRGFCVNVNLECHFYPTGLLAMRALHRLVTGAMKVETARYAKTMRTLRKIEVRTRG